MHSMCSINFIQGPSGPSVNGVLSLLGNVRSRSTFIQFQQRDKVTWTCAHTVWSVMLLVSKTRVVFIMAAWYGPPFCFCFPKASFHPDISLRLDYSCKPIRNGDYQKIKVLADCRWCQTCRTSRKPWSEKNGRHREIPSSAHCAVHPITCESLLQISEKNLGKKVESAKTAALTNAKLRLLDSTPNSGKHQCFHPREPRTWHGGPVHRSGTQLLFSPAIRLSVHRCSIDAKPSRPGFQKTRHDSGLSKTMLHFKN